MPFKRRAKRPRLPRKANPRRRLGRRGVVRRQRRFKTMDRQIIGRPDVLRIPCLLESTATVQATTDVLSSHYFYPMCCNPLDSGSPVATSVVYNGMLQYGQYYNRYRVHGASIDVSFSSLADPSGGTIPMQAVLLALPISVDTIGANPNNSPSIINALTWAQLVSMPGTKRTNLQQGLAGKVGRLKMFRKSKVMFSKSSIRNDIYSAGQCSGSSSHSSWQRPSNNWFFMFGVWLDNNEDIYYTYTVRLKAYIEFFDKNLLVQAALT